MAAKPADCWYGSDPATTAHTVSTSTTLVQQPGDPPPPVTKALVVTWCTRCGTITATKEVAL